MSRHDSTTIENVKVLMLKGEKGAPGETYDDTEIRNLIRSQNATIADLEELVNSYDGTMILRDIATLEDSPNGDSTHAYSAGDWLIYESQLYETTTSIAIGDLLEEGVNLQAVTVAEVLENFQTMLDNALSNMEDTLENMAEEQFNMYYGLMSKTTAINKNSDGDLTSIVETSADAVATSTFSTSGTTTTITTALIPTEGDYNYTKTTVIAEVTNGYTVTESYTRTAKEA